MVLLLAGLPLLARPFLGPVGDSRGARFLRAGTCAALLALIPVEAAVEPGGGHLVLAARGAAEAGRNILDTST